MEFKEPKNFNDILKLQAILDSNINNTRERTLQDIKLSLIAEVIEFNEETEDSHKTWKTKEINKEAQLEELTDILFFIAQWINYKKNNGLMLPEIEELSEVFESEKEINKRIKCTNLISGFFNNFRETSIIFYYTSLTANYGYTLSDILNCYWSKWQKNMLRIGKEWN